MIPHQTEQSRAPLGTAKDYLAENSLSIIKWIGATIVAIWTSLTGVVQLLLILMAADFGTGLISGFVQKKLDSQISYNGIARKTAILILISVVHLAGKPIGIGVDLGGIIAIAYCVNELISIVENCVKCGVPVPGALVDSLAKFKQFRAPEDVQRQLDAMQSGEPSKDIATKPQQS